MYNQQNSFIKRASILANDIQRILNAEYAVAIGSRRTQIACPYRGLLLDEPTCIAYEIIDKKGLVSKEIIAVGQEAEALKGKVGNHIKVINPVVKGVISDFDLAESMLTYFLDKVVTRFIFKFSPKILLSYPQTATPAQKRQFEELLLVCGARSIDLVPLPIAHNIGGKMRGDTLQGCILVDIGTSRIEASVVSCHRVISSYSVLTGGDSINELITNHLREKYAVIIGPVESENIKLQLATAIYNEELDSKTFYTVDCLDAHFSTPKQIRLSKRELYNVLEQELLKVSYCIKKALESIPPDLAKPLIANGITLVGGGSKIPNLASQLTEVFGLNAKIAENPTQTAILGTKKLLEFKKSKKPVISS
ncbi:rod shape-determining protein [Photobacterium leiognathi]|uniref:rod shape-determining protein n=1 Tax=Photobacterium leiognathi TaxID=553611 RepID=UPI002981E705|nr:rod shape-determining protein [Photobacterium leiognathi]